MRLEARCTPRLRLTIRSSPTRSNVLREYGDRQGAWATVPMRHVVLFLRNYLREHWDVLRHAQISGPALGVVALIEK